MLRSVMKTNRNGRQIQFKFQNMSTSPNGLKPLRIFLEFFGIDRYIKKFSFRSKALGGFVLTSGTALFGMFHRGSKTLSEYMEDDEKGTGNKFTVYVKEKIKAIETRYMIGNGVGQGLAWLHYADYLQYVLPDLEKNIQQSKWYKQLSDDQRKRVPMKLYEVIPRKCYVDFTGTDGNIQYVTDIIIDTEKQIKVKIYSVMEGSMIYYCMCNCPKELTTMNHVNDIQKAGISHSKFSKYNFFWKQDSTVQLFDVDTKLVQLMRFYYTLSSLLCRNNTKSERDFKEKARIVLFNESHNTLSKVLLQAIKEDLKVDSAEKTPPDLFLRMKLLAAEYKDGNIDFNVRVANQENAIGNQNGSTEHIKTGTLSNKDSLESDNKTSNIIKKENPTAASLNQKTHRSLLETKLLSEDENMDIFYEFDVFVTGRKDGTNDTTNLEDIRNELINKNMKVLLEKECIGKDWLTKLKYAATKCRWIVFVDTNECIKNKTLSDKETDSIESRQLFASRHVAGSLKSILKSRNVQTVAVVNSKNKLYIIDDLRWVTCIPFPENTKCIDTKNAVYNVVSGSEIKLEKSEQLYFGPGEVAVGLAWNYAAYHLNKILPIMDEEVRKAFVDQTIPLPSKLLLIIPQSGTIRKYLSKEPPTSDQRTESSTGNKFQGELVAYTIQIPDRGPENFIGEYPTPLAVIHQMKEEGLLNEKEMQYEVKEFYKTVDRIMKILLPQKKKDYQFVYFNDDAESLTDVLSEMYNEENAIEPIRIRMCSDNSPF